MKEGYSIKISQIKSSIDDMKDDISSLRKVQQINI